jgi:cytidine kinase
MTSSASPVLVVGSIAFDNIHTPHERVEGLLGGSASYAAIASSYFAPTRLVGVVGHDFTEAHVQRFDRRGIDLEGLQRNTTGKTFFWDGRYEENFSRCTTLEIELNVFADFQPHLPDLYRHTPYVVLGNIQPSLQIHVLDQLHDGAFVAADTRDLWIETTRPELMELLPRINMFLINDSEAQILSGELNLIRAGAAILKMGPSMVVIKKGEHGSLLFHPHGLFAFPAYPVEDLHDTTGAGDSYLGALIGQLAAENRTDLRALKHAIAYATATASLTVEAFGCRKLEEAGREAIDQRYQRLLEISQV